MSDTLSSEVERFVKRLGRELDDASYTWKSQGPLNPWAPQGESLALDLVERDGDFVVTADLPGLDRDAVDVRLTDRTLRIEAEREAVPAADAERFHRRERRRDSVRRSLRLPEPVNASEVTAAMHNGVLTVTLPKLEASGTHTIEIDGE